MILINILVIVYIVSINFYGFMMLLFQKRAFQKGETEKQVKDGKIFLSAILGGAIGIFSGMFILKYRLKSFFFMVGIPVIATLNIYIAILAFKANFWIPIL